MSKPLFTSTQWDFLANWAGRNLDADQMVSLADALEADDDTFFDNKGWLTKAVLVQQTLLERLTYERSKPENLPN